MNQKFNDDYINYIVEKYKDLVYKLAFARTRDRDSADDVFQEVFIKFIKKKPAFNDESHAKAWFIKVTVNVCNSFWRKITKRQTAELDENMISAENEKEDLSEVLDKLPADYRIVIHLFYYEDISTKEISKILGKNESTIRMQLTRARRLLKDFMEGDEEDA